jgi:cytochrome c biogenesis protein CcmG, thiol:disulfide interchange protein DsbE
MYLFLTGCLAAVVIAAMTLRFSRPSAGEVPFLRAMGWLLLAGGLGGLALLMLAVFTGRFGPQHFWFREPVFYISLAVLLGALVWWMRRPAPRLVRFGLPATAVMLAVTAVLLSRADGRSMPLAMSMPTMRAEAPELVYLDGSGQKRTLAELHGRVVLLNFWATWCTPCRREMPLLSKMQREHSDEGLVVLYVSLEEPAVLEPFLAANRFDGIQGRLEHAADYYGAGKFYPLSFLITRDGRVAYRWSGRPREDWLAERVEELL